MALNENLQNVVNDLKTAKESIATSLSKSNLVADDGAAINSTDGFVKIEQAISNSSGNIWDTSDGINLASSGEALLNLEFVCEGIKVYGKGGSGIGTLPPYDSDTNLLVTGMNYNTSDGLNWSLSSNGQFYVNSNSLPVFYAQSLSSDKIYSQLKLVDPTQIVYEDPIIVTTTNQYMINNIIFSKIKYAVGFALHLNTTSTNSAIITSLEYPVCMPGTNKLTGFFASYDYSRGWPYAYINPFIYGTDGWLSFYPTSGSIILPLSSDGNGHAAYFDTINSYTIEFWGYA